MKKVLANQAFTPYAIHIETREEHNCLKSLVVHKPSERTVLDICYNRDVHDEFKCGLFGVMKEETL